MDIKLNGGTFKYGVYVLLVLINATQTSSTLKIKQQRLSSSKCVYPGIAEGLQFGTSKLLRTIGTSGEQSRRAFFCRVVFS